MIAYLKGIVADVSETRLVLDVNNIGYQIFISSREAAAMPGRGEEVKIYTYLNVKEDAMQLFGFLSEDDLEMYRLLLNVNGIGPKAALGILSVLTADDVRFAVLSDDAKSIARAPGVGTKTAQKLILELKDKLSLEDAFEKKLEHTAQAAGKSGLSDAKAEAVQALTALGYSSSDALKAVRRSGADDTMDTEEILKLALKQMAVL
ncbi:MAG: Holliday junction branch migration protein RuvA [Lachnospiraceae bacterium]|uniref:Holliday junction branch migration protein RuvA n=1 Tax=Parablautia sp. Marseille-Q6255 TaxID=3039593 RepID=UPI0024BD4F74|nr:Holliday junction branch migration protein RuvA [Parablautia sp. Marseille-Q6255]